MAKTNYNHARRQKEAARKERQKERLARRQPQVAPPVAPDGGEAVPGPIPPVAGSAV